MKVKILYSKAIHNDTPALSKSSHDTTIVQIGTTKIKLVYECYNANETYTGSIFDGTRLNFLFSMQDLGIQPNSSQYISDAAKREMRVKSLYKAAVEFIEAVV
jgi:hypothetical protein